jgi:hypothetical protein
MFLDIKIEMTEQEIVELLSNILKTKRLNSIQEAVFLGAWLGKNYRDIAAESGYNLDYVREVGSQLWGTLSVVLGRRITKRNVREVFAEVYPVDVVSNSAQSSSQLTPIASITPIAPNGSSLLSGSVPLNSALYIAHTALEAQVCAEVLKPGGLVRIKAPRKMGKTSLVHRVLAQVQKRGLQPVLLNLHWADHSFLRDTSRFLRWFCLNVTREMGLEPKLDDYWDKEIGSKVCSTIYFQEYLLRQINTPVVIALDDVDYLFQYPELSREFLPLLRSWHEESSALDGWAKLRLIVVHSTEVYPTLDIHLSPFNVGLPIKIPELNLQQVQALAHSYGLYNKLQETSQLETLLDLLGGHPYFLQLALYHLSRGANFLQLVQEAPTQSGIYSHYLRSQLTTLRQRPELAAALRQVVESPTGVHLEAIAAYQLESMGIIKLSGDVAQCACSLYQLGASGGWGRLSMVSENRRGYRKGAPPKVHLQ